MTVHQRLLLASFAARTPAECQKVFDYFCIGTLRAWIYIYIYIYICIVRQLESERISVAGVAEKRMDKGPGLKDPQETAKSYGNAF